MHLTGDFDFVIEAGDRVCFGRALDGEQLITSVNDIKEYKPSVSTHGHLPWKGDKPPFIVAGPNAVSGRIIHGGRLIDHAPTILRLLGLEPIGMDGIRWMPWCGPDGKRVTGCPGACLFCLDGTLYHDDRIYLRMIDYYFAGTPWEKETGSVKAEMSRVLAGGQSGLPLRPVCPQGMGGVSWPGHRAAGCAHRGCTPASGPLALAGPEMLVLYLRRLEPGHVPGRRIGWDGEAFWERFQLARRDLLTDGVGPQPDPVLAGRLLRLRDRGIRLVLCSNSRREGGEALLARLGLLGCFDEQIFDAEKPPRHSETYGRVERPLGDTI